MPGQKFYWTRKLELELVKFVRDRDFIWKPYGNTNHHIQQKYKAYAEFASKLGHGFTARIVRDRWVNIRCTFNHNLRRVDKSKTTASTPAQIYVPCWPLWKPLQFLRSTQKKDDNIHDEGYSVQEEFNNSVDVKMEEHLDYEDSENLRIRQRERRTDRPRRKLLSYSKQNSNCTAVIGDLIKTMKPLSRNTEPVNSFWFFGRHVTERLNCMTHGDAEHAREAIMKLLDGFLTEYKVETLT